LSAAPNAAAVSSVSANFIGTASSLTHTAKLSVTVAQSSTGTLNTRTKYVRTDAATEYYLWVNSHWVVYDPPTAHIFVTDPFTNTIIVLDSVAQKQIATINIPGAYGIDETPDRTTLYVGTLIGDVYSIDLATMQIKHRYLSSTIGPYGYQALVALVLSDGRLALLGEQGGIPSVDGSSNIAIWNPADNSIAIYGSFGPVGAPTSPLCGTVNDVHIFGFILTADRANILTGSGSGLCELTASTGQSQAATVNGNTGNIVTSPDGRYLAFPSYPTSVSLYDAHTLNQVGQFNVAGDTSSASDLVFSADSKTLYVPGSAIVYAYDVATFQQIGWMPNIVVEYSSGGFAVGPPTNPIYSVTDNNGLLLGPLEEGFGFLDTTTLRTGPVGTSFTNAYLNPATGPAAGGTQVQLSVPPTVTPQSNIFFAQNRAPSISISGSIATISTPPGAPGPVDVYVVSNDGGMQLVPDGFSYGPTIPQVTPNMSTAEGGGTGVIYGYGFGSASAANIPSDLSVTVGGQLASIQGFNPNAYGITSPPFLLQAIYYTIPPGTAGSAANVSVSTGSGTATASAALSYLPGLKQYPLAGASLAQGVYDPVRDVYYFTDVNKIQVFSKSQGQWLSPIAVPVPSGATPRLWGISLSSDATKLAVADSGAGVVYLLDPSTPTSVKTISATPPSTSGILVLPAGIAINNAGIAYLTVDVQGGTGYHNFYKLDTSTGTLTDLGIDGPGLGPTDLNLRTVMSADGTRVFFNNDGYIFSVDTATGAMFNAAVGQGCCYGDYDLSLAANQIQLEASSYLYDSDLNGAAPFAFNDREILGISYLYGTKFSPDGSLLFQPATQGVDVIDGRIGRLRARIAFSTSLSPSYDALVSDGKDNIIIAITGTTGGGVAVLDLSPLQEPVPLPYAAITAEKTVAPKMQPNNLLTASEVNQSRKTKPPATRLRLIPHVTNAGLQKSLQ
jgi:WD40 repeat protein